MRRLIVFGVAVMVILVAGPGRAGSLAAIAFYEGSWSEYSQTVVGYNSDTGELWVAPPSGLEFTSVNIDSAAAILTGEPAQNLGGSFDNDADNNIFKATFGSSFGSLSFGNVAQTGLSVDLVLNDLTIAGSLAGGGDLGNVGLCCFPEPLSLLLALLGIIGLLHWRRRRT